MNRKLVDLANVEAFFNFRTVQLTQGFKALARRLPPLLKDKNVWEMEPIINAEVRALLKAFALPLPKILLGACGDSAPGAESQGSLGGVE